MPTPLLDLAIVHLRAYERHIERGWPPTRGSSLPYPAGRKVVLVGARGAEQGGVAGLAA